MIILLYHGTMARYKPKFESEGISLKHAKLYADFGKGFYTTPSYSFAKRTAMAVSRKYNSDLTHQHTDGMIVKIDCDEWLMSMLNVKEFDGMSDEWVQFVIYNRVYDKYKPTTNIIGNDIISGCIADDRVASAVGEINYGFRTIDDISINELMAYKDDSKSGYAVQTSFHTEDALACLTITGYDFIEIWGRDYK